MGCLPIASIPGLGRSVLGLCPGLARLIFFENGCFQGPGAFSAVVLCHPKDQSSASLPAHSPGNKGEGASKKKKSGWEITKS